MKAAIRGQLIFWGGCIMAAFPILNLINSVLVFPDGFNVYTVFGGLVLTAVVALYGTSAVLHRLSKKHLKRFYYALAILQGGAILYFFVTNEARSAVNELKWLLFINDMVVFTAFGVIIHFQRQANDKYYNIQLELNKAQLALLRSQINPHFLYNTLNNIDSLVERFPKKASESIIMLSDIMRYMMKESPNERVKLTDEVGYLSNYIALERLRLKKDTFVRFQTEGSLEGFEIAPMLLIPFVENAFKHSVALERDDSIDIKLSVEGSTLQFRCRNPFDPTATEKDETHGIGLNTVQKRLELIYPNMHTLIITRDNTLFDIQLMLKLHAN